MTGRVNGDVRCNLCIVPYPDLADIQNREIVIRIEILADLDVIAVIAMERRIDLDILACLAETICSFMSTEPGVDEPAGDIITDTPLVP